jgi:hypothetical protein
VTKTKNHNPDTRISSFMVEVPSTGEEITLEEAVKRGLVSEETAAMYKQGPML